MLNSKPFKKLLKDEEVDYLAKSLYHFHRAIEALHKHEKEYEKTKYNNSPTNSK